jgi:hypothetical protein
MNDWFTKDRSETASNRMPDRDYNGISVLNPALGINIYRRAYTEEQCQKFIQTLESNLDGSKQYSWQGAMVTNSAEADTSARNALDFKFDSKGLGPRNPDNSDLLDMHQEIFNEMYKCVSDYGRYWGVGMHSFEAFNFVKYEGKGTHFKIHADHGPTYVSTVSIVIYLNDDYEGGEIYFPRLDNLKIKPKAGDIVVFPSIFIYEHASEEMINGTKYAVVIMSDYNDRDSVNRRVPHVITEYELKY